MTEKTTAKREKRIPFGVPQTKLSIPQEIDGFHCHWVNDQNGRIFQAERGGYSFVEPAEVGIPSDESRVKVQAGTLKDGSPMFSYLMKIPMEWYLEDQASGQKQLDTIDRAIQSGKFETTNNNYVPEGGISIK